MRRWGRPGPAAALESAVDRPGAAPEAASGDSPAVLEPVSSWRIAAVAAATADAGLGARASGAFAVAAADWADVGPGAKGAYAAAAAAAIYWAICAVAVVDGPFAGPP